MLVAVVSCLVYSNLLSHKVAIASSWFSPPAYCPSNSNFNKSWFFWLIAAFQKFMSEFNSCLHCRSNVQPYFWIKCAYCCAAMLHIAPAHFTCLLQFPFHAKWLCNCACNKSRFFRINKNCFNLHNSWTLHWNRLKVIGIQWISLTHKSLPAVAADFAGLPARLISPDLKKNRTPVLPLLTLIEGYKDEWSRVLTVRFKVRVLKFH